MDDTITKEQVLNAYNNAPDFVRAAFNDEVTTQVVVGLKAKFQLHIDMAGILAKEVGYLLLGVIDPDTFAKRLKTSGFSEQMVTEIMAELNQKVFVPLRTKMRREGVETGQTPAPVAKVPQQRPMAPPPTPTVGGVSSYSPPLQSPRYSYPENPMPTQPQYQSISKIAPLPPKNVLPRPPSLPAVGGSRPVSGQVPKPMDASRMLEDHEEPHIEFNKTPPAPGVPVREKRVETPLGQALRTVMPSVPPTNLPGVMPKSIAPGARYSSYTVTPKASPVTPPIPPKPIPPVTPPAPLNASPREAPGEHYAKQNVVAAKPYSADPYREPIDEK